ncbi:MAG: hypothetical protein GC151_13970 [Betaproteobacteria bacterium]|nr:hypothetical protein [Betaproteobacteria bacterium]
MGKKLPDYDREGRLKELRGLLADAFEGLPSHAAPDGIVARLVGAHDDLARDIGALFSLVNGVGCAARVRDTADPDVENHEAGIVHAAQLTFAHAEAEARREN